MVAVSIPNVLTNISNEKLHRRLLAEKINAILTGKLNATKENVEVIAATPGNPVTQTVILDPRIGVNSFILLMPLTDEAASIQSSSTIWFSDQTTGATTLNHDSDTTANKIFRMLIIG